MVWALAASLTLNGFLAGLVAGPLIDRWLNPDDDSEENKHIVREVYGGGVPQDPDMDYEWDKTVVGSRIPKRSVGFQRVDGE